MGAKGRILSTDKKQLLFMLDYLKNAQRDDSGNVHSVHSSFKISRVALTWMFKLSSIS